MLGVLPVQAAGALRKQLDAAGMADADLRVQLNAGMLRDCPANSGECKPVTQPAP